MIVEEKVNAGKIVAYVSNPLPFTIYMAHNMCDFMSPGCLLEPNKEVTYSAPFDFFDIYPPVVSSP